jgi:hypothetical protein
LDQRKLISHQIDCTGIADEVNIGLTFDERDK